MTVPPVMVCDFDLPLGVCPGCWKGVPWEGRQIGGVGYRVGGLTICFGCLKGLASIAEVIAGAFERARGQG